MRLLLSCASVLAAVGAAGAYVFWRAQQAPPNAPDRIRRDPARPLVVCAGASVTQGRMGASYVALLEDRLGDRFQFANAGRNGDFAYNLRQRLDPVIALRPQFVVLQIGTNDVSASLSPEFARRFQRMKGLPAPPDRESYREHLAAIARRVRRETPARVAILSLPLLGEDLGSEQNRRVEEYDQVIRDVAVAEGAVYLPLHETMAARIQAHPGRPEPPRNRMVGVAQVEHFLLGRSYDAIGAGYGYQLLSDGMHLNGRGAAVVADVIESYLRQQASTPFERKGE
jgi:lysophospholipase L1-like esterase